MLSVEEENIDEVSRGNSVYPAQAESAETRLMFPAYCCASCPRACRAVRDAGGRHGYCGVGSRVRVARVARHDWEEPPISGTRGSGTIFFSGCNMGCVFCQNHVISQAERIGKDLNSEELLHAMFALRDSGVHNINLVTPSHYADALIPVLRVARMKGLGIPVCWNSSGYDHVNTLKNLEGLVDIYLCDFKYYDNRYAVRYSKTPYYRESVMAALEEMYRQIPQNTVDTDGIMQRGVIVRHLLLPGLYFDSRKVLRYLSEQYGEHLYLSLMNQYTPLYGAENYPEINRKLYPLEYERLLDYAGSLSFEELYYQEGETAGTEWIPHFSNQFEIP